jgi:hypothetical protein
MSINMFVMSIVSQLNDLRVRQIIDEDHETENTESSDNTYKTEPSNGVNEGKSKHRGVLEKNATALIFVILEICIKDLIKYLPNLLNSAGQNQPVAAANKLNSPPSKSSFLYLHVTQCKQLTAEDVELLKKVLSVLNALPFHSYIKLESKSFD